MMCMYMSLYCLSITVCFRRMERLLLPCLCIYRSVSLETIEVFLYCCVSPADAKTSTAVSACLCVSVCVCASASASVFAPVSICMFGVCVLCVCLSVCWWERDRERLCVGCSTGRRRPIGCLKLQVIFRKRATNHRASVSHFPPCDQWLFCGNPCD